MVLRRYNLPKNHSFFIFGPRGTGKSTLLKAAFPASQATWFDLLDADLEDQLARNPSMLRTQLDHVRTQCPKKRWVVIDEVQKVPRLLDVVHQLIEQKHFLFALSGSSARKLRRGQANLLAGRAFVLQMFPFTHVELGADFSLNDALTWGTLPTLQALSTAERAQYLRAYCHTYLKEEVVAEQLVRNVTPFRQFLDIAAQLHGTILNYSKIARDIGVEVPTVRSYYDILEDTLLGFRLEAHHESLRKRQRQHPKFYFFDNGVARALAHTLDLPMTPANYAYGRGFEQWLIAEIFRLNHIMEREWTLTYLLTKDGVEIDLILSKPHHPTRYLEIKSAARIDPKRVRALQRITQGQKHAEAWFVSQDPVPQLIDGVRCLPWQHALRELGLVAGE